MATLKTSVAEIKALRFEDDYFTPDGQSIRGAFLKSPLKFTHISSHFAKRRFHPVLGVHRPHLGVDYAAAKGTPVRAIGDGTITIIGRRGASGNMIKIKHHESYESAYKHLSRFSEGLTVGSRVKQGDLIGYVGATGLATGPHLHFEFYEKGRYVDPLTRQFPRAAPLAKEKFSEFNQIAKNFQATLSATQPLGTAKPM